MLSLVIAILASVSVGILIKFARQKGVVIAQSIAVNYVVASLLCYFLLKPNFQGQTLIEIITTQSYAWIFMALGLLLPSVFLIQAKSLELAGIVRTDAAQRLSLFLPILAAFSLFGESLTIQKTLGLILAFIALFCLFFRNQANTHENKATLFSLMLVWLGFGVIDILFKQTAKMGSAFPLTLFISFIFAGCLIFAYLTLKRSVWQLKNMLVGLLLGVLNFCNILFYIKAHQALKDSPTLVFTGMNLGVICLGTVAGIYLFKEKLHKLNYLGVAIAILAIIILFSNF